MKLRDLETTILATGEVDASKNEEAFAELIQFLDDKCLSLIMHDAVDVCWHWKTANNFSLHRINIPR